MDADVYLGTFAQGVKVGPGTRSNGALCVRAPRFLFASVLFFS